MLISDINLPFFLILIGPPSSYKTTILTIVGVLPDCYTSDSFTAKSFVSHVANVKEEELKKIDLLPRIRNKTLITPELGPLFSAKDDKLQEIIGILTKILDGKGYRSESGARGGRGYSGDYYFTWLGATVKVPRRLWKLIGDLGPKMYFLGILLEDISDLEKQQKILHNLEGQSYNSKLDETKQQALRFWEELVAHHGQNKILWDKTKDDPATKERIVSLAILLSKLRTRLSFERTSEGIEYEPPTVEDPSRASASLMNLAKGHAVLDRRNYLTKDDLGVAIRVALSSAYRERIELLKLLLENDGEINTAQVIDKLRVSRQTALNTMRELEHIGIVDAIRQPGNTKFIAAIKLQEHFAWLLDEELKQFLKS